MNIDILFKRDSLLKSTGILFLFYILQSIIGMAKGIVFARCLGPEEYGIYSLASFSISIIIPLAVLGIPSSYNRYIPKYEEQGMLKDFIKKVYVITFITGIIISFIYMTFSDFFSKMIYNNPDYKQVILLCGVIVFITTIFRNLSATFFGLRFFRTQALFKFSYNFVFTLIGIIFVLFYSNRAIAALQANLISLIIIILLFSFLFINKLKKIVNQNKRIKEKSFYKRIFNFSIWYLFTPWLMILFRFTDRWMITRFLGLQDVGIYSVMGNLSAMIMAIGMIVSKVLSPNLAKEWEEGKKDKVIKKINFAIKVSIILLLGFAIIFAIFKSKIIFLLYGSKYMEGIHIINIFLIFYLINIIWGVIAIYSDLIEKTYLHFTASFIGLGLNVILNYKLIPIYGILGAVSATCTSFGLMTLILYFLNRYHKLKINISTIIVFLSPLILLFNNVIMVISYLLILLISLKTNFIIYNEEKVLIMRKAKVIKNKLIYHFHK